MNQARVAIISVPASKCVSTGQDVGIIILVLVFIGTVYSFQQYCGNIAPAYDLSQLADVQIQKIVFKKIINIA
jgi:hypothetical protein